MKTKDGKRESFELGSFADATRRSSPDSKLCSRPVKVGLSEYLASLKRIDRALSHMMSKNLRVNQQAIGDFNELLSEGSVHLQNLFRSILASNVQLVEPLHYITKRRSQDDSR